MLCWAKVCVGVTGEGRKLKVTLGLERNDHNN